MPAGGPKYRLFESTGFLYPDPFPAFADSDDFDALAAWAETHNDWKGDRTVALIVSDEGRFWKVHPNGSVVEISNVPGRTGVSQVDRYAARLARGPSPGDHRYESPPPERWQHKTIHVPPYENLDARTEFHERPEAGDAIQAIDATKADSAITLAGSSAAPLGNGSSAVEEEPTTSGGLRDFRANSRFGNYRLKRLLGKGEDGLDAANLLADRYPAVTPSS